jgi:NarL family two-component system response regulator LiaR
MKVLLVDDHQMMRDGLRATLAREPDVEVVGEAGDGHAAITAARALHPDVVVMDISMPGLNGLEATRHILAESPGIKVVALSMHSDRRYVHAAFEAGATGYLLKNSASDELVRALRAAGRGQHYVSPAIAGLIVEGFVAGGGAPGEGAPPVDLSSREREVLQLLAEGSTSKDVAARLGVAVSTVETHRRQISVKLGIHSIAGLTKYAIRHGLTSVE